MSQIPESELILNHDGSVYHLNLHPYEIAPIIINVGDPDRVSMVSNYFDKVDVKKQKREFVTHTGIYKGKAMSVISTGIGTDNIDIVYNELDALVNTSPSTSVKTPRMVWWDRTSSELSRLWGSILSLVKPGRPFLCFSSTVQKPKRPPVTRTANLPSKPSAKRRAVGIHRPPQALGRPPFPAGATSTVLTTNARIRTTAHRPCVSAAGTGRLTI